MTTQTDTPSGLTRERLDEIREAYIDGGIDPDAFTELLNHAELTIPSKDQQ